MSEDVAKLPKWAQQRIRGLERDLADTRHALDAFAGTEPTLIRCEPSPMSSVRFLPNRTNVEYTLEHGEIEVGLRDGELRVIATGKGELVVQPQSSNVVALKLIAEE